jgi:ferredoxin
MDQSCPVVHKSRRQKARLQTAKLFCNNCGVSHRTCPRGLQIQNMKHKIVIEIPPYYIDTLLGGGYQHPTHMYGFAN